MVEIELTLDVARPPPPYIFTPHYQCGYAARDDMLVGSLDRELCISAEHSRTGKAECSQWCGLLSREEIGFDLTAPGKSLVSVVIPLIDLSKRVELVSVDDGLFAYVGVARISG